MLQQSAL